MAHRQPPRLEGFVCLGVVAGAHGIRGELKLKSFTTVAEDMAHYGALVDEHQRPFAIQSIRTGGKFLVARVENIVDRTAAENMQGLFLYTARENLPPAQEDELLYDDLLGMKVLFADGSEAGTVQNVFSNTAQDVLEISGGPQALLIPFVEEYVTEVDPHAKTITLAPQANDFLDI